MKLPDDDLKRSKHVGVVLSVLKYFKWTLYRCICWLIVEVKLDYICMFTFRILIYSSYISSKYFNLLWCYLDLGSLMLLDIVNVCAAAKKHKKLALSVGIVMHDRLKYGKKTRV